MGTRVYTWEEMQAMPFPEQFTPTKSLDELRLAAKLSPAQEAQCRQIQQDSYTDGSKEYVIGYGRDFHFVDSVAIFVTPNFDVSDPERFPDELDRAPVIYVKMPPAMPY